MIHVVARSQAHGQAFYDRHITLRDSIVIEIDHKSYADVINSVVETGSSEWACIVHDDVFLCSDFTDKIRAAASILDNEWPNWGLAGNAGVVPVQVGYGGSRVVRYLADPHGGPNLIGYILPATSIDGNVMLLNIKALRERSVGVLRSDGYQLYDLILSLEVIKSGLGVFVVPQLACWHGSKGDQGAFDAAKKSEAVLSYLGNMVTNRYLETLNGLVHIPFRGAPRTESRRIDVEMDGLRATCRRRQAKKVAIVTRTQFRRPWLLERCLSTIAAFSSLAGTATEFCSYVVTDHEPPAQGALGSSTLLRAFFDDRQDTRYKLVEFAARNIDADYFWFIDDDDWLFPNEAERLGLIVSLAPKNAVLFVDCTQFDEKHLSGGVLDDAESYRSSVRRAFPAEDYILSLSGHNRTPFCGAIFARDALLGIPTRAYNTITRYEDFMATLWTLLGTNGLPIVVGKLYCGISIRDYGNSVTEQDRSEWDRSMSELVSHVVNASGACQLVSLSLGSRRPISIEIGEAEASKALLDAVARSRSWRVTRPLRGIARLVRGEIGLREFVRRSMKG